MGWHRNHAISHSPNQFFFEDTFVSNPWGPNEQFGTHEKLSWGGVQGNLNWMPGYHVLLNLLNELGKRDKMRGMPSILFLFRNEFNKFNNT